MYAAVKKSGDSFSIERYGSVSVVFQKKSGDDVYLGLITAKHVVMDNVGFETKLFKTLRYDAILDTSESAYPLQNYSIVQIKTSAEFDLALIIVKVSSGEAKVLPAIPITEKCSLSEGDALVIIGFPAVMQRAYRDQNVFISSPKVITKRWSTGQYVNERAKNEYGPLIGATADALHGNSGGPVIDSQGKLIGVQAAIKYNGLKYYGNESRNNLVGHSWIVDCQATKNFALKSWDFFLETIEE